MQNFLPESCFFHVVLLIGPSSTQKPTVSRQLILIGGCALKKLAGNISQIKWSFQIIGGAQVGPNRIRSLLGSLCFPGAHDIGSSWESQSKSSCHQIRMHCVYHNHDTIFGPA
ncbi:hypothetical protein BDZ94DRAFT_1245971 [Collybia nuda]|uniref:Uncharacterized protein n=1 Tax=Collybia nuda TaxID=64659 RepID=A0A9P6CQ51_9AGAR|nr:hypothetical protein BDZ94DRAFT_1245971 [Collybia nuda]